MRWWTHIISLILGFPLPNELLVIQVPTFVVRNAILPATGCSAALQKKPAHRLPCLQDSLRFGREPRGSGVSGIETTRNHNKKKLRRIPNPGICRSKVNKRGAPRGKAKKGSKVGFAPGERILSLEIAGQGYSGGSKGRRSDCSCRPDKIVASIPLCRST